MCTVNKHNLVGPVERRRECRKVHPLVRPWGCHPLLDDAGGILVEWEQAGNGDDPHKFITAQTLPSSPLFSFSQTDLQHLLLAGPDFVDALAKFGLSVRLHRQTEP